MKLLHSTDCRWMRNFETAGMLREQRHKIKLVVTPMAENERAAKFGKKAEPSLPHAVDKLDLEPLPEDDQGFLSEDDEDAGYRIPEQFQGHGDNVLNQLAAISDLELEAVRDVGYGHNRLFNLVETMACHSDFATDQFSNDFVRQSAKMYIDWNIGSTSTLSVPDLQDKLSANRHLLWQTMVAGTFSVAGKSMLHYGCAMTLMKCAVQNYFFECYDGQFGIWESLAVGTTTHSDDEIIRMLDVYPFALSLWAKKAARCWCLEDRKEWVRAKVKDTNRCFPLSEKEQESQFKDRDAFKAHARSTGDSLWSKQADRQTNAENHCRYLSDNKCVLDDNVAELGADMIENVARTCLQADDMTLSHEFKTALDEELELLQDGCGGEGPMRTSIFNYGPCDLVGS